MDEKYTLKAYKGFNKDMTCKDFHYEEGGEYEMPENEVKVCSKGFHSCERPLDILGYYSPANSVYHEVEIGGKMDKNGEDTKVASSRIKVGAKLDIRGLVKAHIEFVREHCTTEYTDPKLATAGEYGAATAGDSGAATAGYSGAATAGDSGAATAGEYGAATAGEYGAATTGEYGAATAGYRGAATAGEYGAATAGNSGAATSRGSVAVGEDGVATARATTPKAKGGLGAVLVLAREQEYSYDLAEWKAEVVDGERIKADTWYTLKDGRFIECE